MKKKILYIHHGKGLGGAPLSLLYLIEALDKTVYEPIVLFLHDSDAVNLFREKNIKIVGPINRYNFPHTQIWWFRWYHIGPFLRSLRDTILTLFYDAPYWLDHIKPDILHLNTSSLGAWAYAAHKKKIPIVWHIREPLAEGYLGIRKKLTILCVEKYASAIVPICKDHARYWEKNQKIQVVYNAVPQGVFNEQVEYQSFLDRYHLNPDAPKILFLGGLSQEKGTAVIFETFRKLLSELPQAKLLVAGYFDLTNKSSLIKQFFPARLYQKKVTELFEQIKHATVLLGPIRNVPEAMAASNIVVFPATVGHFARPIIEAGFMKRPIVASKLPAIDELVIDGKTGFLVNPDDHDAWVEKLVMLLIDQALQKKMGASAFDFCTQQFSLKHHGAQIESIYYKVERNTHVK